MLKHFFILFLTISTFMMAPQASDKEPLTPGIGDDARPARPKSAYGPRTPLKVRKPDVNASDDKTEKADGKS